MWLVLLLVGCASEVAAPAPVAPPALPAAEVAPPAPVAPPEPPPAVDAPALAADQIVRIPAGTLRAGSWPGTVGRDPGSEADLIPVEVPAFEIDRLPYPNDPSIAPRTGVSRAEAAALCEEQGKRLCEELEWERACAGDGPRSFPTGEAIDLEHCALDASACLSPFGIAAMGTALAEWTASPAARGIGNEVLTAVTRGAPATAELPEHRCASRHAASPERRSASLGFRCCRGAAPSLAYPEERARAMYRVLTVAPEELRRVLGSVPEVARWAADFEPFNELQIQAPLGRAGRTAEDMPGWLFTSGPLRWSPTAGEETWVVAGSGGGAVLLVVLYPMPDGSFRHGASFILENETTPIAIGYSNGSRRELLWSGCWGCGGEGGAITFREDGRIVIVQR